MKLPYKLIGGVSGVAIAAALSFAPNSPVTISDAFAANPNNPAGLRIASPHKNEKVGGVYEIKAVTGKNAVVTAVDFCYSDLASACVVFHTDTNGLDGWSADWDTIDVPAGEAGISVNAYDGGTIVGQKGVIITVVK